MVAQYIRWDFIGLSTDEKPTSANEKVTNGSTYYESDTSKYYVYYEGTWYEKTDTSGGTSDFDELTNRPKYNGEDMSSETNIPEVVTYTDFTGTDGQTAGTSGLVPAPTTTDGDKYLKGDGTWGIIAGGDTVYSGKTTSSSNTGGSVYIGNLNANQEEQPDPTITDNHYKYFWALPYNNSDVPKSSTVNIMGRVNAPNAISIKSDKNNGNYGIAIGTLASIQQDENNIAIGYQATSYMGSNSVSLGAVTETDAAYCIALGTGAYAQTKGEMNIGTARLGNNYGYNNSEYRLISGVYDGQGLHDAATVAQGNTLSTSAPDSSTVGVLGQLWTDTTNMHTYQCTAISGSTYTWTQRW